MRRMRCSLELFLLYLDVLDVVNLVRLVDGWVGHLGRLQVSRVCSHPGQARPERVVLDKSGKHKLAVLLGIHGSGRVMPIIFIALSVIQLAFDSVNFIDLDNFWLLGIWETCDGHETTFYVTCTTWWPQSTDWRARTPPALWDRATLPWSPGTRRPASRRGSFPRRRRCSRFCRIPKHPVRSQSWKTTDYFLRTSPSSHTARVCTVLLILGFWAFRSFPQFFRVSVWAFGPFSSMIQGIWEIFGNWVNVYFLAVHSKPDDFQYVSPLLQKWDIRRNKKEQEELVPKPLLLRSANPLWMCFFTIFSTRMGLTQSCHALYWWQNPK